MKLKTLKDLKCGLHIHIDHATLNKECCVMFKDLKAEAIKWVKFYLEQGSYLEAAGIRAFHNITSEDLK